MAYYSDHIRRIADETFSVDDAHFALYDADNETHNDALDEQLNEALFDGAMNEMVTYIYERVRELGPDGGEHPFFDAANVDAIYISSRGLVAPTIVVEYDELPEWFEMESADTREFYYYPKPARSGEWTVGQFQFRAGL